MNVLGVLPYNWYTFIAPNRLQERMDRGCMPIFIPEQYKRVIVKCSTRALLIRAPALLDTSQPVHRYPEGMGMNGAGRGYVDALQRVIY